MNRGGKRTSRSWTSCRRLTDALHLKQICGWQRAPPLALRLAKARRLVRLIMPPRIGVQHAAERAHLRLRMCVSHTCCAWALWAGLWTSIQQAHVPLSLCAACTEPWGSGGGAMQHIWPCLSRAWSRFRLRRRARLSAQKIGSWAWCVRVQCGVRK